MKVAIKVEKQQMSEYLSLEREVEILKKLRGIPQTQQIMWFGNHNGLKVMVTKMLGFDLIYFLRKHKKFSQERIFNVARQMIEILENIHKNSISLLSIFSSNKQFFFLHLIIHPLKQTEALQSSPQMEFLFEIKIISSFD